MVDIPYKRVLIKLSGERLGSERDPHDPQILDVKEINRFADEIIAVHKAGIEVGLVFGAGNIIRGREAAAAGFEECQAHYMGMLATVMNALAMQNALETLDMPTRVMSALPISAVCEPYIRRRAMRHLEKRRVVIFAAGTGNPFFTTDTAAALRASEMGCSALLKGTRVDGVYSADPEKDPDAVRYDQLSYLQVLSEDLKVMDASAVSLARENSIPILVFSIEDTGGFQRVLRHEGKFTIVS